MMVPHFFHQLFSIVAPLSSYVLEQFSVDLTRVMLSSPDCRSFQDHLDRVVVVIPHGYSLDLKCDIENLKITGTPTSYQEVSDVCSSRKFADLM